MGAEVEVTPLWLGPAQPIKARRMSAIDNLIGSVPNSALLWRRAERAQYVTGTESRRRHEPGFDSLDLRGLQRLTALVVNGFGDLPSAVLHELNLRIHHFPEELGGGFGIDLEFRLAG